MPDPYLDRLARIIAESGLSRRQFARIVLGRDLSGFQGYFTQNQRIPNGLRSWINSVESVKLRGGKVVVIHRVYAPTRAMSIKDETC